MLEPFQTFLDSLRSVREEWYEVLLKKPLFLLEGQRLKARRMFGKLPPRQAATIYAGLLWVVPIAMVQPYLSLYLYRLGLSKTEIGVYQSLMNGMRPLALFLGGYLSDTWGRKKTLVAFDILSWGGYSLCLALATDKWWCVAALFFMAANSGSTAPYLCLLSEGVQSKKRALVFSVLQIVNMAPSLLFFPLLGGLWVAREGLVPANHQMYWLQAALIAVGIGLRLKFLPESEAYEKSASSWFHVLRDGLRQYRRALTVFFRKPGSRTFLLSKLLDEWMIAVWGIYASLYFVQRMGLRDSSLAVLPQVAVYVSFLVLYLFVPGLPERRLRGILGLDQLFGMAALAVLFLPLPAGGNVLLVCLLSTALGVVGSSLYGSVSAAVWMNLMEERERAKVVAASYAVIYIGLLTASLGALLYGLVSPLALLWVMMGLRAVNFLLLRRVARALAG